MKKILILIGLFIVATIYIVFCVYCIVGFERFEIPYNIDTKLACLAGVYGSITFYFLSSIVVEIIDLIVEKIKRKKVQES